MAEATASTPYCAMKAVTKSLGHQFVAGHRENPGTLVNINMV
jgi:hypothetical protein